MTTTTSPRAPFAVKLRAELDRKGWGIRRLAREIAPENPEPARRQIHRHLSGAHAPSRVTRHRYADALGVERAALADDDEEDEPAMRDAFHLFVDLMGQIDTAQKKKNARKRAERVQP